MNNDDFMSFVGYQQYGGGGGSGCGANIVIYGILLLSCAIFSEAAVRNCCLVK